jgi:hypothetical protein
MCRVDDEDEGLASDVRKNTPCASSSIESDGKTVGNLACDDTMDLLLVLAGLGSGEDRDRGIGESRTEARTPVKTTPTLRVEPCSYPSGRMLLNTLLPNLKNKTLSRARGAERVDDDGDDHDDKRDEDYGISRRFASSPDDFASTSTSIASMTESMAHSAARVEAIVTALATRVDAMEKKIDQILSEMRASREEGESGDRACVTDDDSPPVSPVPTPITSPCLVRATPSPSLVNAFAELYA